MSNRRHTRGRAKDASDKGAETASPRPAQDRRTWPLLSDVGKVRTLLRGRRARKGGFWGAGTVGFFSWALDIQVCLVRENSLAVPTPRRIFIFGTYAVIRGFRETVPVGVAAAKTMTKRSRGSKVGRKQESGCSARPDTPLLRRQGPEEGDHTEDQDSRSSQGPLCHPHPPGQPCAWRKSSCAITGR